MSETIFTTHNQYIAQDTFEGAALPANPLTLFNSWLHMAEQHENKDANAMVLSTCAHNKPSSRVVLLKGIKDNSLLWFSNYASTKAQQLALNNNCAVNFWWPEIARQVRFGGKVKKLSSQASDEYFRSRDRASQIGAWASPQSKAITSHAELQAKVQQITQRFANQAEIPRPQFWGGYQLRINFAEFWLGKQSRLHERLSYTLQDNKWRQELLAP